MRNDLRETVAAELRGIEKDFEVHPDAIAGINRILALLATGEKVEPTPPRHCAECGTAMVNAPGIGDYCPKEACDNLDGPAREDTPPIQSQGGSTSIIRKALESALAGVWDGHYSGTGVTIGYAQAVDAEVKTALAALEGVKEGEGSGSPKGSPAMLALEGLTPGGSEYVGDIARCVEYVRDLVDGKHKMIVKLIREGKAKGPTSPVPPGLDLVREAVDLVLPYTEHSEACQQDDGSTGPCICGLSLKLKSLKEAMEGSPTAEVGALRWTSERPKAPGFYWVRIFESTPGLVEEVFRDSKGLFTIDEEGRKDRDLDGYWWAGPIAEPGPVASGEGQP